MAGLPHAQMGRGQMAPESIVDDYLQKGLRDIQQRGQLQGDEVYKRSKVLGFREASRMINEIGSKMQQDALKLQQSAQQHRDNLARVDTLAQQGGFDPYEAKMRMVITPEEAAAMFPRQKEGRSVEAQYGELDVYENRLKDQTNDFVVEEAGKVKHWYLPSFLESTRPTKAYARSYDPSETSAVSFEGKKGFYVPAKPEDIRVMSAIKQELKNVRQRKQELLSQPDIATRVQTTMLKGKRDPVHDMLTTRLQKSAGMEQPKPSTPRQTAPERQAVTPTAEQLKKMNTKEAYETGVKLGYWE